MGAQPGNSDIPPDGSPTGGGGGGNAILGVLGCVFGAFGVAPCTSVVALRPRPRSDRRDLRLGRPPERQRRRAAGPPAAEASLPAELPSIHLDDLLRVRNPLGGGPMGPVSSFLPSPKCGS